MDTVASDSNTSSFDEALDLPCERAADAVFVEPLESFMRLHGWDERVVQRLDLLHVIAVQASAATVVFSETVDSLSAGEVLLVPPGMPFGLSCADDVKGYVVALSTEQCARIEALSDAFAQAVDAGEATRFSPRTPERTASQFDALLAVSGATGRDALLDVHAALCGVLSYLFSCQAESAKSAVTPASRGAAELVQAFNGIVERDFRTQRPLSDYCEALDVTERALRRATQKCVGLTPLQLIHARSVREAKRLLRFTNVSVAQVGMALGFDDPAYFNRFFKKAVGESPRAWRVARAQA